ncbi:MAG: SdpI family protein [Flavobacteriales bacterium]|nr:SdpI family protein [Flavobacteriales bacterium]
MVALVPGAMLLVIALLVRRFPPLRPDHWYGYRSARSMRSTEAWQEANTFSGKLLLWGSLLVLNTGVTCALLVSEGENGLLIVSIVAALVLVAIPIATELRLNDLFGDDSGG